MKIGIYSGTIPPPIFIENLVNGLADIGNKVFIYGKPGEGYYQSSNSSIIQRKIPVTKFGVIPYFIFSLIRLIIIKPHICLTLVNMIRQHSTNWIQFLKRSCRVLPPFIDNLDIFHIQWAKTLVQYPEFIEKIKCPVVLSLRGTHINVSPLSDEQLALSYKKYFPQIHGFHAVSQSISKEVEKYGADIKKITVIKPAVEEKLLNYKADRTKNLDSNTLHIISVGRCHWIKGYTFALDAMSILRKEKVDFHYTIIASGRDQENIFYQIHDLGLSEYVTFINGLSHKEAIDKISESDLFLLSSVGEGISNVVLEAMALGIPVISTDCGGMEEVIKNEGNGFVISVREPKLIAIQIQRFLKISNNDRLAMINNARETIRENYLLGEQIDKMQHFYQTHFL